MARLEQRLNAQRALRRKRTFALFGIFMALILMVSAGMVYYWLNSGFDVKRSDALISAQGKVNIMVLGVDERSDDVGRSDTLFVLTVDTKSKSVSMLSIPRDTRVKIPGHGYDKINHAYASGGHKLTQQTVENLLGIPIDYYVAVNFSGFQKIVDAIGGVDIEVEKRMYYEDPYDDDGLVIDLKSGLQHMDGKTAMQYVRYRDGEGDIGRVQRQQKFIKALLAKAASPLTIPRIPALIQELNGAVKTNMSTGEMLNLAMIINDAYKQGLRADMVPGKPAYINSVSYWIPDLVELRQHVAQTLGVEMSEKYLGAARRDEADYRASIPKEMKIIDTPKPAQEDKTRQDKTQTAAADKNKTAAKPSDSANVQSKSSVPAKLRVEIINASGQAEAGEKMAAIMRKQGFEVAAVVNYSVTYQNTVVVANTTNTAVINKLTSLPFRYAMQVKKDEGKSSQATVVIGKDFIEK